MLLFSGVDLKGSGGCSELGEGGRGGNECVVVEGKELVSGDATVDCEQCTSLVGVTMAEANSKFILGGVLGGSIIIWGISGWGEDWEWVGVSLKTATVVESCLCQPAFPIYQRGSARS